MLSHLQAIHAHVLSLLEGSDVGCVESDADGIGAELAAGTTELRELAEAVDALATFSQWHVA